MGKTDPQQRKPAPSRIVMRKKDGKREGVTKRESDKRKMKTVNHRQRKLTPSRIVIPKKDRVTNREWPKNTLKARTQTEKRERKMEPLPNNPTPSPIVMQKRNRVTKSEPDKRRMKTVNHRQKKADNKLNSDAKKEQSEKKGVAKQLKAGMKSKTPAEDSSLSGAPVKSTASGKFTVSDAK